MAEMLSIRFPVMMFWVTLMKNDRIIIHKTPVPCCCQAEKAAMVTVY